MSKYLLSTSAKVKKCTIFDNMLFFSRRRSILVLYQRTHAESSANGITSFAIKIAIFFGILMCGALGIANKETVFPAREDSFSITNETRLPATFFIISVCWVFLSGSWMLWNDEARFFVYRKLCNSLHICISRVSAERPKYKRILTRRNPNPKRTKERSCDCETDNACPNCIAKEMIKRTRSRKLRH